MYDAILVVCVGNICRSPVGERLLRASFPLRVVNSAGLAAVVGQSADETTAIAASEHGVDLGGHVARQLTAEVASRYDLVLAMEPEHRQAIMVKFPQLSGRVMLFDQWNGARGIPDPYGKPLEAHRATVNQLIEASEGWVRKLGGRK